MLYQGSCHCRSVTFTVEAPLTLEADLCNCSICKKAGFLHLIVPISKFQLLSGEESLSIYRFNSGVARHTFCKVCGIKAFYTPRSNPDGMDVNVHCLDTQPAHLNITEFDGQHWQANAASLTHKSIEHE